MVVFRLLFPLAVFIPCASLSEDRSFLEEKCTRKSASNFCQFVKRAQGLSKEVLDRLNGEMDGKGKRILLKVYSLVTAVVKNTSEARTKLKSAFRVEISALVLVENDCSNLYKKLQNETEKQQGLEETCRFVDGNIKLAMSNIVKALIETERDPKKREAARKAFENFEHGVLTLW
ncbi:unnamed protein product [Nippostrongylus brasiliensis]|uniref:PMEI domain-containing protein n=1 Tax=Nippostrongylus brasiliensis TaxID=27835 RepID=A0A0N4XHF7_NIPBR|nr:unnamed protein product [Nippostrongylus brasiliensis]